MFNYYKIWRQCSTVIRSGNVYAQGVLVLSVSFTGRVVSVYIISEDIYEQGMSIVLSVSWLRSNNADKCYTLGHLKMSTRRVSSIAVTARSSNTDECFTL